MNPLIRIVMLGLLAATLVFSGACRGGGTTGPQPVQEAPPTPSSIPTPSSTPTSPPTPTPSPTPTPPPAAAVTPEPEEPGEPSEPGEPGEPGEVMISWDAQAFNREVVLGFHIFRGRTEEGPWRQITDELIDIDSGEDGIINFLDQGVVMKQMYYYRIQAVTRVGERVFYGGPIPIVVNRPRGHTPQ